MVLAAERAGSGMSSSVTEEAMAGHTEPQKSCPECSALTTGLVYNLCTAQTLSNLVRTQIQGQLYEYIS